MFYPSSENKGADQFRGYCEADLRLCFRIGKNLVFSRCGSLMIRNISKYTMWFLNRSDTIRAVQAQKMVRGCKFWILKVEELYYLCSEHKCADHLRSYCEADLRL